MTVWQALVSIAFLVMLAMTIWAWAQNASLREQLAEQRAARIEQATRAHHMSRELDAMRASLQLLAFAMDMAVSDKKVVEDMNRILAGEYNARQAATQAGRDKGGHIRL